MSGKHTLNAWRFLCQIEAGEYCTGEAGPKYGRRGLAQSTRVGAVRPTFRENLGRYRPSSQADCRRPEGSWHRASRGPDGLITKPFCREGVCDLERIERIKPLDIEVRQRDVAMRYPALVSCASLLAGTVFAFTTSAWAAGGMSAGGIGVGGGFGGIGVGGGG